MFVPESCNHHCPHDPALLPVLTTTGKYFMELTGPRAKRLPAYIRKAIALIESMPVLVLWDLPDEQPERPTRNESLQSALWCLLDSLKQLDRHKYQYRYWHDMSEERRRALRPEKPSSFDTVPSLMRRVEINYDWVCELMKERLK